MANEYFKRVYTSSGNRKIHTISFWTKQNKYGDQHLFSSGNSSADRSLLEFIQGATYKNQIDLSHIESSSVVSRNITVDEHRDTGSWIHILVSTNTTVASTSNHHKIFVNGKLLDPQVTNFSTDFETFFCDAVSHRIGERSYTTSSPYSGQMFDFFLVDGQALSPEVFGFYKEGNGYISAGSTQVTDYRPGQWVPKAPRVIKSEINRRGGFGVNGIYLPLNDSANFGADFHCTPNSIIKLQENLPQPRVSIDADAQAGLAYTDVLRDDPYAANLVLAVPFVNGGLGTDGTSSGINTGFGDYSHIIRGSGTPKVGIITASSDISIANVSAGETAGVYYGSGAKFTGTGQGFLTYDHSSDFDLGGDDFTIEAWVYVNLYNFSIFYIWDTSSEKSYNLHMGNGSGGTQGECPTFGWSLDGSAATFIEAPNDYAPRQQWHHIAAERYGNIITVYCNGTPVGINTDVTGSFYTSTKEIIVGNNHEYSGTEWGYLQDLRLYKGVAKYKGSFDVIKPYTPVGIHTWREVSDTTKNNFCTLSYVAESITGGRASLFDGALKYSGDLNERNVISSTIGVSTGKWYFETRIGDKGNLSDSHAILISNRSSSAAGTAVNGSLLGNNGGTFPSVGISNDASGALRLYGSFGNITIESSWWADDMIVGFAFDVAGDSISIYKNGSLTTTRSIDLSYVNSTTTGIGTTCGSNAWTPVLEFESSSSRTPASNWIMNFGQNPSFGGNETAGTYTDSNGKGLFKYEPPTGYLALCTDNLDTPTISDPGDYFKTVLWEGDGAVGRRITGIGFTPDLVWIKCRTSTTDQSLYDVVRGPTVRLDSAASRTDLIESDLLGSFNPDGFSIGSDSEINQNGDRYVAWCWRAGAGTTSINTDGDINSIVSVNQDAGFSIVGWEHDGGANPRQIGHGLGKAPSMIILKHRNANSNWRVYHRAIDAPATKNIHLEDNSTGAQTESDFGDTLPTSTVFSTSTTGVTGRKLIAYCWTDVEGFSKFGSYMGNGNADGAFVYCGFKPALIIIRNLYGAGNWQMYDSARNPANPARRNLMANTTSVVGENSVSINGYDIDFLSNGFKLRGTDSDRNAANNVYIFAAWAESPLSTANAK